MTPERWQQINDLFHSAVERAPEDRAAFLEEACHGDESLRREVEAFIALDERAENFIESPAFEVAPELLTNDTAGALVGESIGHYRIESLIGVGGMGEVYLARDDLLGRKVALKFLPQSLTADEAQLSRLEDEARTASALNHPNILTVHEIGVDGSRHFIATEFIEGETLRAVLARGKLDLRKALDIAIQVGSALAAAHKSGVLHRDIKPENIMLRPDAYVKVLDFGIAKLSEHRPASDSHDIGTKAVLETRGGLVIGTARYMSPEQARGMTVDARTDIWSFGVILYEMLAGTPPFEGKTPRECIAAMLKKKPSWLALEARQVPARLEQIIRKALRKDKADRHQSMEEVLADLRRLQEVSESITTGWKRHKKVTAFLAASVAVALVVAGLFIYLRPTQTGTNTLAGNAPPLSSVIPEKSIAVLPFENLSRDPDNAFFADGVQDQVLTNLAQIADLKVISRTSVMQYKSGAPRNLREIGQQLSVGRVVEGSVQRAGSRVRVTAQLIDARSHTHLWAQTYDRDLADVFAIQSEIAKAIADQLQARLSPNEKKAIEQPPTFDIVAFDLYSRARTLSLTSFSSRLEPILRQAVDLLNQAVARDPSFFLAHCELVRSHDQLYSQGHDHSPARLALADAALEAAIRLGPGAGDAHLARAGHLYRGYRDHDGALAELEIARRTLPNDPRVSELTGYILRRRGQQEEGLRNLERAVELDPRNFFTLQQIALSYFLLRRYSEQAAILDRALSIKPDDADTKVARAYIPFNEKGDTRVLHQTLDEIRAKDPEAIKSVADDWLLCALAERDAGNAQNALFALGDNFIGDDAVHLYRDFGEGLLARMVSDEARAHAAFTAARAEQEKRVQSQPDYGPALCVLGLIDAALGRKEEALREGRRAIELLPVEKDSVNGAHMIEYFAITAAWLGEKDLACDQLAKAVPLSGAYLSYGGLKLLPYWDSLRGDPRFEKIVASLAPEAVAKSVPQKSIAVLPFENLSKEKADAFFADGVQDEILTNLSRVADLKVISRASVMQYKSGVARNLRKIGEQLNVGHIVEGSVQRTGNRVRINVRLVDARSDQHLWAQTYDRDVADVFAIQSEIAEHIVSHLESKLSHQEKHAIEEKPTADLAAHDLYIRAKILIATSHYSTPRVEILLQAVHLLNQATERDPAFALAYYQLAEAHDQLFFGGIDHTPTRLALADAAIQSLARLRPNSGEAHLALGKHLYWGYRDYDHAREKLKLSQKSLPNDPLPSEMLGFIDRRQGRWTESIKNLEHAIELDPQNGAFLGQLAFSYSSLRRYTDAERILKRAIAITPKDPNLRVALAAIELDRHADPHPLILTVEGIVAQDSREAPNLAGVWIFALLCGRDFDAASRGLAVLSIDGCFDDNVPFPRAWCEGVIAQMRGDKAAARAAFISARTDAAKLVAEQSGYAEAHCVLGMVDAALGNKEDAISEGRRAVELLPVTKDAMGGALLVRNLAIIYAWTGEEDLAFEQLAIAAAIPGSFSHGQLKLHPFWDPLRGDPRFEKIVASLAPKE